MCDVHFRLYYYDLASVVAKWNAAFARSCSAGQVKHYLAEGVVVGGKRKRFQMFFIQMFKSRVYLLLHLQWSVL